MDLVLVTIISLYFSVRHSVDLANKSGACHAFIHTLDKEQYRHFVRINYVHMIDNLVKEPVEKGVEILAIQVSMVRAVGRLRADMTRIKFHSMVSSQPYKHYVRARC